MKKRQIFFVLLFGQLSIGIFVLQLVSFSRSVVAADVVAQHALITTAHPVASEVGLNILKQGGNAVDAAMAVAFALSLAEPNASGIGGGGFLLIKMAALENPVMIDYRELAPEKATADYYYSNETSFRELTRQGPNAVGIPGLVSCAEIALKQFGTMSLEKILQPAIELCRYGMPVSDKLNAMITENMEKILCYPATAEIYLKDMLPLQTGDTLRNPDLATSLEKIAHEGSDVFYSGELARKISAEVQQLGGILALSDLQFYQAKLRAPVTGSYRGYEIISSAPPSGGGMFLIELLNIMEGYDVKKLGHNSADFIHLFSEALKLIFADKSLNAADPDFYKLPIELLTSKDYAANLRSRISPDSAKFDYQPKNLTARESNNTSHFSIVDAQGNVVALTQSINHWFGSGVVVPGTGILLNDHLSDFDSQAGLPNSIEPHKRPTSSIAPTIILKDGKPFLTLGSPGGTRIISALAQIIMNVIDFEMSMDDAIEAPRVHCFSDVLHVEGRIEPAVLDALSQRGHDIRVHAGFDNYFGGAQGILIDPETRQLFGGADSRRDGTALGF